MKRAFPTVFKSHDEQPIYKYRHSQDFISLKTTKKKKERVVLLNSALLSLPFGILMFFVT